MAVKNILETLESITGFVWKAKSVPPDDGRYLISCGDWHWPVLKERANETLLAHSIVKEIKSNWDSRNPKLTAADLSPCPFCGNRPLLARGHSFYALCENCLAQSGAFGEDWVAVGYWNRRANIEVAYQVIQSEIETSGAILEEGEEGYWAGFIDACLAVKVGIDEALSHCSPAPVQATAVVASRGRKQATSNKQREKQPNWIVYCNCGHKVLITKQSPEASSGQCLNPNCMTWYTIDWDGDILPPVDFDVIESIERCPRCFENNINVKGRQKGEHCGRCGGFLEVLW